MASELSRQFATQEYEQELKKTLKDFPSSTFQEIRNRCLQGHDPTTEQGVLISGLVAARDTCRYRLPLRLFHVSDLPHSDVDALPLDPNSSKTEKPSSHKNKSSDGEPRTLSAPRMPSDSGQESGGSKDEEPNGSNHSLPIDADNHHTSANTSPLTPKTPFPTNLPKTEIDVFPQLSISRESSHWPNYLAPPKRGRKLCDWICQIEYNASNLDPLFPQVVFPLGHLVVQGVKEITHKIECTVFETATWFCTPSWFVVVVDLARPQKPVWLVRDPYNLGWSTASDSDADSDTDSEKPNDRITGLTNASHKIEENDAGSSSSLKESIILRKIHKNSSNGFMRTTLT
ncbi:hypothetical protein LTS15_010371 [Exophiala xenobiotica]|nr:hypothetical protein LTS15_010371 [Exophiala xenobiotica]